MDMRNEEQVLDDAVSEALGLHSAQESAAYERGIATHAAGRKADRQMRETAARLSAASPHMQPGAALRGRILEATATRTFKMEDYRKATREDYRFYKWGFYAAAMFLILGAMYNINVGGKLKIANQNIVAIQNQANDLLKQQAAQFAATGHERDEALAAFVDPRGIPVTWTDPATNKPFGRGIVNASTHKALLIFPQELIPAGLTGQLTVKGDDETVVTYATTVVTASAKDLNLVVPANAPSFENMLAVKKLTPDQGSSVAQNAGISP